MRKLMLLLSLACAFVACEDEKTNWGNENGQTTGVGYIKFASDGLSVNVENEFANGDVEPASVTRASEAELAAYTIEIWNAAGEKVSSFAYGDRESNYTTSAYDSSRRGVAVPIGSYVVKAYSAETPEESDTPQYAGQTTVEVKKESVSNASIVCKLSSVKVSVRYDGILASLITDQTQSRMVLGTENTSSYTFTGRPVTPAAAGTTLADGLSIMEWDAEGGYRYLRPNEATNPLVLYLTTTYNGSAIKDQALKVCDDAKPGEWRKVTVKLENGDSGTVYIKVEVSTWVEGEEVDVDVTTMAINFGESGIPDDSDAPVIEWVNHDLSQPFTITDAMFNSAGTYTEGAEFLVETKSEITSMTLSLSTTNSDLAAAATDMGLNAEGGLELTGSLSTTTKMIVGGWGFPTANIAGQTSLSFDLSALMTDLHTNYAGTHGFTLSVTDKNGSSSAVTLNVTSGLVVDPNIQWVGYDIDQRYDISKDDDTEMKLLMTAKSGIKSLVVTINGALAPLLADVNLPNSFDLVDPGQNLEGGDLAENLTGLGFPVGDEVKDKTSLSFDITSFKAMLVVAPGETDFNVVLTDNDGNVIEKAMMINMIVE